jgi:beta-glucosidase/6-phospho-beta-glucosidase/beta-galactosidase
LLGAGEAHRPRTTAPEGIPLRRRHLDRGLPIGAYLHWSLIDNYEWGSYQPRFGIHGVDRERGTRVLDTDAMGRDSAGAYRRLIERLRAGDRSVLRAPS